MGCLPGKPRTSPHQKMDMNQLFPGAGAKPLPAVAGSETFPSFLPKGSEAIASHLYNKVSDSVSRSGAPVRADRKEKIQ